MHFRPTRTLKLTAKTHENWYLEEDSFPFGAFEPIFKGYDILVLGKISYLISKNISAMQGTMSSGICGLGSAMAEQTATALVDPTSRGEKKTSATVQKRHVVLIS